MDTEDFSFVPFEPPVESLISKEYQLYDTCKQSIISDQRTQLKRSSLISDDEEQSRAKISAADQRARVGMKCTIDGYHNQIKRGLLLSNNDQVLKKQFPSNIGEDRLMRVSIPLNLLFIVHQKKIINSSSVRILYVTAVVTITRGPNGTLRENKKVLKRHKLKINIFFLREKSCPYSRAENPDNGLCPLCMELGIVKFCNKEMGLLQHLRQSHPNIYNQRKAMQ
jgi:hypothetical protein